MNTPHRRFDEAGMEILSEAECHNLLGSVPVGRLVFTQSALPAVRLVDFIVDNMTIVFPASDGDKYRAAERGDVVGFEVDEIDLDRHLGWTVTAVGHLSVVEPNEKANLQHILPLRPWAAQRDHHLIRLGIESLEGRRLDGYAQRPYGDTSRDGTRPG
jgi:nitroimidazol reductase NimA-like FMN-containing flavoprotein (pyridoxamine 5'-phosphate oxidase superfamily)